MRQSPIGGPGGYQPEVEEIRAINRTGSAIVQGQVVQLDLANSDGDVSDNSIGATTSGFRNVIAPAAATPGRILAVYLGTASLADNAEGLFAVSGKVKALVQKNSGSIAAGNGLVASTSGYFDADSSAGDVICAVALEAATDPSTAQLKDVLFDGVLLNTTHS
jgi:hypothetical protein